MTRKIILAVLPLLLAGCATAHGAPRHLAQGDWRFTLIDGVKPVSGKTKLSIRANQIDAYVGCNGIGGDLKIEQDHLIVGGPISTKMWCDGVMDQERAIEQLLAASPEYRLSRSKLTLSGASHTAELEPLK